MSPTSIDWTRSLRGGLDAYAHMLWALTAGILRPTSARGRRRGGRVRTSRYMPHQSQRERLRRISNGEHLRYV